MIDRRELFAVDRPADDDPASAQLRQIKGMERLTALEHHVVRHVDDIVHALDAHRRQPVDEPLRARADPDAPDHAGRIEGAHVWRMDLDGHALGGPARAFERPRVGHVERAGEQQRRLPGHADVPEAIGAVARHLDIDGRIGPDRLGRLMIEPRHEEPLHERLRRRLNLHVIRQPVEGDDHGVRTAPET